MLEAFIHGAVLAFGLILPLGPQNVFVFNQGALQSRLFKALPAVVTASLCDTLLILLAVLGVSVIVLTLSWLKIIIFVIGFFFLIYIGWMIWNSKGGIPRDGHKQSTLKQITFAISVSLLNPHAILDTIGVIGTGSLAYTDMEKLAFTIACVAVSWLWFIGLAVSGGLIGRVDGDGRWIRRMNKLSALIIWGVAVYFGWQIIQLLG
ncbi:LysE/ArgO family amino acid transporter [Camelliibacillus cellulosilyticus]|uniref:LysE/ArgO family amino acid transporter n=1 Tax=Camelliibacillus cellulosilyticus TaxID=2174486 RepID=A0ABV9GQB0_9BACL